MNRISFNDYVEARSENETLDEGIWDQIKAGFQTAGGLASDAWQGLKQKGKDVKRDFDIRATRSKIASIVANLESKMKNVTTAVRQSMVDGYKNTKEAVAEVKVERQKLEEAMKNLEIGGKSIMDPQDMSAISTINRAVSKYLNNKMGHLNKVGKEMKDMLVQTQEEDKEIARILQSVSANLGAQMKYGKAQAKSTPVYGGRLPGLESPAGAMDKGIYGMAPKMMGRIKDAGGI